MKLIKLLPFQQKVFDLFKDDNRSIVIWARNCGKTQIQTLLYKKYLKELENNLLKCNRIILDEY